MSDERGKPYKTIGLALTILCIALIPRVWALGILPTPDESRWVRRSADLFVDLLTMTPQVTIEDGVPGVTTRWTGMAGLLLNYSTQSPDADLLEFLTTLNPEDFGLLPSMRLPTAIVTAICVMVMYLLARRMFGEWPALIAGVLLALEPFLIGLSRLIHTDALVTSFIGVTVLGFLVYLGEERSRTWPLLLAGVAAGLALLSKSTALFLLPYILLVAAASCWRWEERRPRLDRTRVRRALVGVVGWGLIAGVVVVALWPAMWVDPLGAVGQVFHLGTFFATTPHESGNYFLGQAVDDPGAFFYPVVFLFRVTPLTLIGALITPFLLHRRSWPGQFYLVALWAFVLLFIAFVTFGAKKMDRYVLPTILFADVLAGVGLTHLLDLLRQGLARWRLSMSARSRTLVSGLVVVLMLVLQAVLLWPHSPYYFTYYNPLLGGTHIAAAVIPVGWGKSCDLTAQYLNQKDHAADLDVATLHTSSCLEPSFVGTAWSLETESLGQRTGLPWYAVDYVVVHANQVQRDKPNKTFLDFFRTQTPEHVVRVAGFDYAWIYPVPETIPESVLPASRCPIYKVSAGNFDHQVWLRHFAVGDATFQREASFAAGETAHLALQWRTEQPLSSQYKVFAHVYDSQGRLVTQADDLLGGWNRGQKLQVLPSKTIMNYLTLTLPAATPPGGYALAVGLYDDATGQRLGLLDPAGQASGTVAFLGTLRVTRPTTPPAIADLHIQHPLDTQFQEGLTLLGYDLQPTEGRAGEPLSVALYWQAQRDNLPDLTVELQLRDAADRVWAKRISRPADGTYPTSQWTASEIVRDVHDLTVDAATPPGDMRLMLAIHTVNPSILPKEIMLATVPILGRQHVFQAPTVSHPMPVDLAQARFLGYDLDPDTVKPGEPLRLTLYWQCRDRMTTSYKVFVHLIDAGYGVWGQVDRFPCDGECPTTGWLPGEYLMDTYELVPRPETPPGMYRIAVGLYDEQTGTRLPRVDGTGDHILLDALIKVQ